MKQRVTGFDLARALAIFGMIIVNFKIVVNAETSSPLLISFAKLFEGRASALFVILAGIGDGSALGITTEEMRFLFSISIIPPLPQYIISAASSAVVVLVGCLYFSEKHSSINGAPSVSYTNLRRIPALKRVASLRWHLQTQQ